MNTPYNSSRNPEFTPTCIAPDKNANVEAILALSYSSSNIVVLCNAASSLANAIPFSTAEAVMILMTAKEPEEMISNKTTCMKIESFTKFSFSF